MSEGAHRKDSYYVVSNPQPIEDDCVVLFTGSSQTKPGHKPGPKVVDYYLLHHILSGRGTYTCQGITYKLGPGDSFLIEPGKLISYTADEEEPWHYRWLAFEGKRASVLLSQIGLSSQQPIVHTGRSRNISVMYHQVQAAFQTRLPNANLKATGYLHLLLAEYSEALQPQQQSNPQQSSVTEHIVQQALHYLSTQYAEPITIELMAEALGYNRAYLSTLFKKQTGLTPVSFLLKLRIDKAKLLLRERLELTIEQIASSVGFQDPLYFSKQFKRLYGISPTDYRTAMKHL
ncbi:MULTISPECIES: AraC family transcriptional regulator [Paenibacillus]|uniref:AraC family transcriptional regulator n=1 Tax=Paenibacillus radicis (ex Xue et al. 2023) TaxID=2972489 RepID=A0ABT1YSS5_9BACL|nr:AraC family transcriptional regulator [Paenibacillus radicis (ex Xue et al. 2023)]MCR8636057.1 AraC family transcriptional regulator [Paenibacillus radicis (ex Xue et al. 2023)]